ncbi:MAG: futalosine hydrolase [Acidobacteriota bacterium]
MNLLLVAATEMECALVRKSARTIVTGVGAVNAAHALTVAVEKERPEAIIIIGIGGAYPNSGLQIGDVACAESETYGDLGVESPEGFLDISSLGFLQTTYPLQLFPAPRKARFVTVSTCSGTDDLSQRIQSRTKGEVENMEGAAIAHIAAKYGIPTGEIRGISNLTGNRDRASWKVKEAAETAQQTLLAWLNLSSNPR